MSNEQTTVERPSRGDANATDIACAIFEGGGGGGGEDGLINLSAIECFSHPIAELSEGKLTGSENDKAIIRVKIRPSVFIIETKKEYTVEEISTTSLNELVRKRVSAFRGSSIGVESANKRRRLCRDIQDANRIIVDKAASTLETLSGLLPVVINVKKNWSVGDNEEIQIELKGNQGVEELVNLSHVDASAWELERLTALVLDSVQGVYYARHNILDVVVTKSHVSGRILTNPIIFRLGHFKVWINTPLQLALPTIDSKTAAESAGKVLYRHPSLNRLQDLKDMAEKSKSVSSILIPGVSKFTVSDLETVSRGSGTFHYFTAQCFFSKKDVSLKDLIAKQYMRQNNATTTPATLAAPSPVHTAPVSTTTATKSTTSDADAEAKTVLHSDVDVLATLLSSEYMKRRQQRQQQQPPAYSSPCPPPSSSSSSKDVSLDASITCFFGPEYHSIADCLAAEDGLTMHILPASLDSATVNRALVATQDNSVMEIHNSGRFLDLTYQSAVFVPDVSVDTLKTMLRGAGNASCVGAVVASTLFYNNVNLSLDGGAVSASGSMNLSDVIVEFFPGDSARLVGEVAGAVASVYRIDSGGGGSGDNNSILFPNASIMAERRSYNRSYQWSDPISCVVGLYTTTMDTFMKKVRRGNPVSRVDADWVNMHTNVLQVVLVPFFDAVLKTGAWVIREVRQLIRAIVEDTLLKYTATPDHHTALGFNQALLDTVSQLVVHWAVMQSAAENEGVCKAFPRDPPFVIEPGVSLKNYTLSDTPAYLLNGDNLADKLRMVMASPDPSKRSPSGSHARSVSLSVPSARFLKSNKDFPVLITIPDRDEDITDESYHSSSLPPPYTLFLDFSPPRLLLTPNVKYSSEGGFTLLKDKGLLTGKYQITKESKRQQNRRLNRTADDADSFLVGGEEVEGVRTGFTVDGKIEHISVFLPGSISKSSGPPQLPVNSTKQSNYSIKDMGMQTVFFEPLLSSLSLRNAAKEKRVNVKSVNFFEECLSPLVRGRIDIFPKRGGSDSAASAGFEWLWKTMQAKKGFTTNIKKLMHRASNITSAKKTIITIVANSWSGVYSQLSAACIQLKANAKTLGVGGGANRRSLPPATATVTGEAEQQQQQQQSQAATTTTPTPVVHPPFEPTFLDIQTFLQQHLKNVISTLTARMMMVVSNAELRIIKNVSENVSKTILDSLYVAMEPEKAIRDIIERISFEQNGIVVDLGGRMWGEAMRYAMSGSIFVNQSEPRPSANPTATASSENAPVPPHLEAIFERLHSLGSEQPPLPRDATTTATTTTTAAVTPTSVPPTQQEIINHNTQMKKIRDASSLTSRLLRLIRDDGKQERVDNVITEATTKYRRTPSYFTAIKPTQPMLKGLVTHIPGNVKPNDLNFSSAQELYVPVNPRHLLTDMQWLKCLSTIESATRDSVQVTHHFQKEATDTTDRLKNMLQAWQKLVTSVTDENLSSSLSSLRIDWFNKEASRIAAIREQAERSRIAVAVQGKIVNLDTFGMVAVARSLIDIDYYVKMPNMWSNRDWKGLVYTAMAIAAIPLAANISRGMMAASQSSMLFDSTLSLYSAEETIRSV